MRPSLIRRLLRCSYSHVAMKDDGVCVAAYPIRLHNHNLCGSMRFIQVFCIAARRLPCVPTTQSRTTVTPGDNQCGNACAGELQSIDPLAPPPSFAGCFVENGSRDLQDGPRSYGYALASRAKACCSSSHLALQNNGW